ncbi:MAG: hypothetical protein V4646_14920 [Pseudomonadota bacterium]
MNITKRSLATILIAVLQMSGCSVLTPPANIEVLEKDGAYWANYSADRRGSIIQKTSANGTTSVRVCSEPSPDTASDFEAQASAIKTGIAQASGSIGQHVVVLPGRDSTVLALRDALYSLCLLSLNNDIKPEALVDSYIQVVGAITQYARAKAAVEVAQAGTVNWRGAQEEERKGFQNIVNGDLKAARLNFARAEAYYPSYHNTYEIGRELAKIENINGDKTEKTKELYKKIVDSWSWGVPSEDLEKIREKSK